MPLTQFLIVIAFVLVASGLTIWIGATVGLFSFPGVALSLGLLVVALSARGPLRPR